MRAQFRQGDVFLIQIEKLPEEAREEKQPERIVLAYGEVTGHSHSIASTDAKLYNFSGQHYLVVEASANLVHEEHETIALVGGVYKVVRQREFKPSGEIHYVED